MTLQSIGTGRTHICLGSHTGLTGEGMNAAMKQHPICENLHTMMFCRGKSVGLSQVGHKVFLEFVSEKCSGTDGATTGGEHVRSGGINKVRYAFSATFFRDGFKKLAIRDRL